MRENQFQKLLIVKLKGMFPGIVVLKNDAGYLQGMSDLLLLYKDRWAALEVKASEGARRQPNQDYYVEMLNEMSFASFIYPENEESVLFDLRAFFN